MGFSVGSALRFGWETFKRRPWFFVGTTFVILLISGLINAFTSGIDALFTGSPQEPSLAGMLVDIALGTLLSMGMTAFYLVAHDSPEAADLSLLWHPQPFWNISACMSWSFWRSRRDSSCSSCRASSLR